MNRRPTLLSFACKPFARLCAVGLVALTGSAMAGEIVLYEHSRFRGRSETLFAAMYDLSGMRFANEVSSIVVKSGTWELCTERSYRGTCRTFNSGEYSQLEDINDAVRSVREVQTRPVQPPVASQPPRTQYPAYVDASRGTTIYEHGNFAGRSLSLNAPTPNFESLGMNDMVSSIIVRGGMWEFCMHANYQPPCRMFGPGDHFQVGEQFNDQFSSARPVDSGNSFPSAQAPQRPQPSQPPVQNNQAQAYLYSGEGFRGGSRTLTGRVDNFDDIDFNDRVSSIIINQGNWLFCSDANFRGSCQTLGPGRYSSLDGELRSRISSARPTRGSGNSQGDWGGNSGWGSGNWSGNRGSVTLYEYEDFGGRSYNITGFMNNLDNTGFNDRASSVVVQSGRWEFCTDANFRGTCRTVGPGRYESLPSDMDSKISSARQIGN